MTGTTVVKNCFQSCSLLVPGVLLACAIGAPFLCISARRDMRDHWISAFNLQNLQGSELPVHAKARKKIHRVDEVIKRTSAAIKATETEIKAKEADNEAMEVDGKAYHAQQSIPTMF